MYGYNILNELIIAKTDTPTSANTASHIVDKPKTLKISAASIAASEPSPPMAIPISDKARTGASFIPSPINTIFPLLLPLMRTPLLEAPPIPAKKLKGIDKTNAQGQDTTTEYRITTNYFSWYRFTR